MPRTETARRAPIAPAMAAPARADEDRGGVADPFAIAARAVSKSFPVAATSWRDALRSSLNPLRPRPRATALHPTDLSIAAGTTTALVGENGAGKTTLLRVLAGLLIPERGGVHLDDAGPASPAELRRAVAWVPCDDRSFVPRLSARENLRYFADLHPGSPIADARIAEVLVELDLEGHATRAFRTLSSGQRQRLAIARGWLRSPRILILDEPTRSLDPEGSARLFGWLAARRREDPSRTVVLSTHRLDEARAHSDRIVTIAAGRVTADRPVPRGATDGPRRITLRTAPPLEAEERVRLPGVVISRETWGGLEITLGEDGTVDRLIDHLRARGIGIVALLPHDADPAHPNPEAPGGSA